MRYTLWHHDRLVGETTFEHTGPAPRQRLGLLHPTAHGREMLPQLCGFLGATLALKREMEQRGLMTEREQADGVSGALEDSVEGSRVLSIVKQLSELELHSPDGTCLVVRSLAITDLRELATLAAQLGDTHDISSEATASDGSPRYLISATFDENSPRATLPLPRLTSRH